MLLACLLPALPGPARPGCSDCALQTSLPVLRAPSHMLPLLHLPACCSDYALQNGLIGEGMHSALKLVGWLFWRSVLEQRWQHARLPPSTACAGCC